MSSTFVRSLAFLFGSLIITFLISCSQSGNDNTLPNIIYIMTDDQGYGDIAYEGNPHIQTPNIDALAENSVRLTNFHSVTTCAPTRASLMTGLNCNTVGVWHTILGRSFLNKDYKILPEYLKDAGYTTGIFGKWHLGDNHPYRPQDRGFDEVLIHGGGGVGQTPDLWNNDYFDDTYLHNGLPEAYKGYCTDVWFGEAIQFINKSSKKNEPFFAYISTNSPHGPYNVARKYADIYKNNSEIPNPEFYGMIHNIDENLGILIKAIKAAGIEENTILVYTTDNGTAAGVNLGEGQYVTKGYNASMRGKKGSEYEGGHRVPMYINFPEKMEIKAKAYNHLTSCVDILPTFLDIVNIENNDNQDIDGLSLMKLFKSNGDPKLNQRILISDKQRVNRPVKWKNTSVMLSKWRLVNDSELYNIFDDPEQRNNLIIDSLNIASLLRNEYDEWWKEREGEFLQNNYIPIGSNGVNSVLLTAHDWITPNQPPWHQNHVRNAKIDNGYWNLQVIQKGTYRFSLYRWPPSINTAMNSDVELGSDIEGIKPFPIGKALEIVSSKIEIQSQKESNEVLAGSILSTFDLELEVGTSTLKTWLIDKTEVERGAYYVQVEKIE